MKKAFGDQGFSLIEILISMVIMFLVLAMAAQFLQSFQRSYSIEQEVTNMEQGLRMGMEFLVREVREAGNNPQKLTMIPVTVDPNQDGVNNDIRLRRDINPPDDWTGTVSDPYEDITLSYDSTKRAIMMTDHVTGAASQPLVEDAISGVTFTLIKADGTVTTSAGQAVAVRIQVDGQTKVKDRRTNHYVTASLTSDVALRYR